MTERAEFLGRARAARASSGGFVPSRPVVSLDKVPDVEQRVDAADGLDLVEHFARSFSTVGGHVRRCAPSEVGDAVADACSGRGPVLIDDRFPLTIAAHETLAWPSCGFDAAAGAFVGVVPATAAIASTGSIVVDSDRAGRLVSLLPRVAIFVVDPTTIVRLTGDVLRHPAKWWPDGLPTNLVVITGPSRSADIEMSLVVDVHGPGEVHAVIVERGAA
jgi:L-lactate utilization protein LutC